MEQMQIAYVVLTLRYCFKAVLLQILSLMKRLLSCAADVSLF